MKIISVVGARPNFIKIAPFLREIKNYNNSNPELAIDHVLVHTGQHYDRNMSQTFFDELNISQPDINLEIGSGTHSEQVGKTMIEFEKVLVKEKPDWVVVVGDVNATLACSVAAKKEHIKVCHIEAGIRSGDMEMPEEINRIVTDRISDLLLSPDRIAVENLKKEGVPDYKIRFVGNIMIDSLDYNLENAGLLNLNDIISDNILNSKLFDTNPDLKFALVTLHRPVNVDSIEVLERIVNFLINEVSEKYFIVWPVHPRTQNQLNIISTADQLKNNPKILILSPVSYFEMLKLTMNAKIVFTDSGGVQEETTVLGIPCITLRDNTERPATLIENGGTGILTGNNIDVIRESFSFSETWKYSPFRPELWDGSTSRRCLNAIINF